MSRSARVLAPLALASLLLTGAPPALAQPETEIVSHDRSGSLLNIKFPGGTMEEFVQALKASIPGPFNVLLRRQAAELEVPPMDLQMVSPRSAFELAVPEQGTWIKIQPDGSQIQFFREFKTIGGEDRASAPVYIIDATEQLMNSDPFKGVRAGPSPKIEIYSIQNAVRNDTDVQNLLTAIDTALSLNEDDRVAEVKYHAETALLIVRATPNQISTIERVIDQFRDSSRSKESERAHQSMRLATLAAELVELRAAKLRAEADLYLNVQELERMKESQSSSPAQLAEAEVRIHQAEAELQAADARHRIKLEQYNATKEQLEAFAPSTEPVATETRHYTLGDTTAARQIAKRILEELDQVSDHVRSVHPRADASVSIDADKEGHRFVSLLVRAIETAPDWTRSSPGGHADRDASYGWVREIWGQDFYDTLVP
ncbi:MAG: hypothetical protein ACIARR_04375 [Phycisphaerales bacterium JB059]